MVTVQVLRESRKEYWNLDCKQDSDGRTSIKLIGPGGDTWAASGPIVWETVRTLRVQGEARGLRLCCNGARVDAHPSAMAISMGGGGKVYLLKKGRKVKRRDLVDIFGSAPEDKIGTVAEQDQFYNDWLESFR